MNLVQKIGEMLMKQAPTILAGIAVGGVLSTAFLAGKAAVKANEHLKEEHPDEELGLKETFKETWRFYVPAAGVGALTIAAIVTSNSMHLKRNLALAGLYTVAERALNEYQDEIVKEVGEFTEQRVRDNVAQTRLNENPVSKTEVFVTGRGDTLCYESFTGRYFKSDMEAIRKALNDINATLINDGYISLNDVFDAIGLRQNRQGEEVGWNSDQLVEFVFSAMIADDGQPCIVIDYRNMPKPNYYKTH